MEVVSQTNFTQAALKGIQDGKTKEVLFQEVIEPALSNIDNFN